MKMVKIAEYDELNGVMNLEKYNEWYETIRHNNRSKAEEMFKYLSSDEVKTYTNQEFNFGDNVLNSSLKEWIYKPSKALFLAAIFNSYDILDFFFEIQVDFKQKDKSGDNIVHSLIFMCYNDRHQKQQCIGAYEYLVAMLPSETTKEILLMENQDGFRPLELAILVSAALNSSVLSLTPSLCTKQWRTNVACRSFPGMISQNMNPRDPKLEVLTHPCVLSRNWKNISLSIQTLKKYWNHQ